MTYKISSIPFSELPLTGTQESFLPELKKISQQENICFVILDDDPTGSQTVYDVKVTTEWGVADLQHLIASEQVFFLLTNSRSLPQKQATKLAQEIGNNLLEAAKDTKKKIVPISRGDSTLRGHYPAETNAFNNAFKQPEAVTILVPAFFQGGRYTYKNIHWVKEGEDLIPAANTNFAQDPFFEFTSSNLMDYVEEKTKGHINNKNVVSFSIQDIRSNDINTITQKIINVKSGGVAIVNAIEPIDLEKFSLALLKAISAKKKVLLRCAASIVPILFGQNPKSLLSSKDLHVSNKNTLIVVGSFVKKTSNQLAKLLSANVVKEVELDVEFLLQEGASYIDEVTNKIDSLMRQGEDIVIYTSRKLVGANSENKGLDVGKIVSNAIISIIRTLETIPSTILSKGGITSYDIAAKALCIKQANVLGQLLPGVPVWQLEEESKFKHMNYIVFPGNVGDEDALLNAYKIITHK